MLLTVSGTFFGLIPADLTVALLLDITSTSLLLACLHRCCCAGQRPGNGRQWDSLPPRFAPSDVHSLPDRDQVRGQQQLSLPGGPDQGTWRRRHARRRRGPSGSRSRENGTEKAAARMTVEGRRGHAPAPQMPSPMVGGSEATVPGNYASAPNGVAARGRAAMRQTPARATGAVAQADARSGS